MKCQKKPAEKKSILTPSYLPKICRPEHNCSSKSSFFHYSIIEAHPINYEYGPSPIQIAFTLSTFSELLIEMDFTMKAPENYYNAEKYSQSEAISNPG